MVEKVEIGKRYRVIDDECEFFNPGDVVVALESDNVPYCVLEKDYDSKKELYYYDTEDYSPLCDSELEELEEGEV